MALEYSDRARIGYAELYRQLNEITIFIEDEAGRVIYERLMDAILGDGSVKRVFPLNGRDIVIREWRKNVGDFSSIYIIDGDLDILFGEAVVIENLYQHDEYAIENFLVEPEYFFKVIEDYDNGRNTRQTIEEKFSLTVSRCVSAFFPLFQLYAVSHALKTGEMTVKDSCVRYLKNGNPDRSSIFLRMVRLSRSVRQLVGYEGFKEAIRFLRSISMPIAKRKARVSAKDYIFPALHLMARKEFKYTGDRQVLVRQMSRHITSDSAPRLREYILSVIDR